MRQISPSVEALLRETAETIVLPRFRNLAANEIEEKSPGEIVTVVDRESELRLAEGLARLLPEAQIIGEEGCAADPTLLDRIDEELVWLIDPIDGTANFAQGKTPFGLMIALLENGERRASWIFDPVSGRMCHAVAGGGAYLNGRRIAARETGAALPVAELGMKFLSEDRRADVLRRVEGVFVIAPFVRCAAEQYPRVALGQNDIALFERALPWDHAPGALFVEEAGAVIRRPDGSAYRVGDGRRGLIAASSQRMWDRAAKVLFG